MGFLRVASAAAPPCLPPYLRFPLHDIWTLNRRNISKEFALFFFKQQLVHSVWIRLARRKLRPEHRKTGRDRASDEAKQCHSTPPGRHTTEPPSLLAVPRPRAATGRWGTLASTATSIATSTATSTTKTTTLTATTSTTPITTTTTITRSHPSYELLDRIRDLPAVVPQHRVFAPLEPHDAHKVRLDQCRSHRPGTPVIVTGTQQLPHVTTLAPSTPRPRSARAPDARHDTTGVRGEEFGEAVLPLAAHHAHAA